jgi:hypothetical protein
MQDLKHIKADRSTFRKQNPVHIEPKWTYAVLLVVFFLIGCVEPTINAIMG